MSRVVHTARIVWGSHKAEKIVAVMIFLQSLTVQVDDTQFAVVDTDLGNKEAKTDAFEDEAEGRRYEGQEEPAREETV